MENNSGGGFMFPFISGLVAGAVLGILFAPDRGSETRKRLMTTVNNLQDTFNETFNEGGNAMAGSESEYSSGHDGYSSRSSSSSSGRKGSQNNY